MAKRRAIGSFGVAMVRRKKARTTPFQARRCAPHQPRPSCRCTCARRGHCSAPLRSHFVHRPDRRSMSLDASGPQRMMNGTNATGVRCRHRSHTT
jgi:hypothetical protein